MLSKTVYEVRVENLLRLIKRYKTQEALQSLTGIASSTFSRIKPWTPAEEHPHAKRMGEKLARRIEKGLDLPIHWMDTVHDDTVSIPVLCVETPSPSRVDHLSPKLSSIQVATRDTLVKLMDAGKLPDTACLKLLQSWQSAVEDLEAPPASV